MSFLYVKEHPLKCSFTIVSEVVGRDTFEEGSGFVYLEGLECTGNENSLLECPRDVEEVGLSQCDHSQDVGIRCYGILILKTFIIRG